MNSRRSFLFQKLLSKFSSLHQWQKVKTKYPCLGNMRDFCQKELWIWTSDLIISKKKKFHQKLPLEIDTPELVKRQGEYLEIISACQPNRFVIQVFSTRQVLPKQLAIVAVGVLQIRRESQLDHQFAPLTSCRGPLRYA